MFEQALPSLPVACPSCGQIMAIRDVVALAPPMSLSRLREQAVTAYIGQHPNELRECFRPGCLQYVLFQVSIHANLKCLRQVSQIAAVQSQ